MMIGIGTDLVHVPRIAALITRRGFPRLAGRILSPQETIDWNSLPVDDDTRRVRFLAVRWGVKEAAYKALYSHVEPTWKQLTYCGLGKNGLKPALTYDGRFARVSRLHVSVSHDGEYVTATVIAEGGSQNE